MKRTNLSGRGADIFFPSAVKRRRISRTLVEQKESPSEKTLNALRPGVSRTLVEQNRGRVAKYRKAWKKKGLTQMALWLPTEVAGELRAKSEAVGKSISALAGEILSKGL